jgi:hypothetical protein
LPESEAERDGESVLVSVAWGDYVLAAAVLEPGERFWVGEAAPKGAALDLLLPQEKLAIASWPLVAWNGRECVAVIPALATGRVFALAPASTELSESLEIARGRGRASSEVPGGWELPLVRGERVVIELGEYVIRLTPERPGKRSERRGVKLDAGIASAFGLTLAAAAAWIGALAAFVPPLGLTEDEDVDRERVARMVHYLGALAEKEAKRREEPQSGPADDRGAPERASGPGAPGESGAAGKPNSPKHGRMAIAGNADAPTLSRADALKMVEDFGMIGLLSGAKSGLPGAIAMDVTKGADALSAQGNLWSDNIGEGAGMGGLALSGIGEGGGIPNGTGIGLGGIGTAFGGLGRCLGTECGPGGFGKSGRRGMREHVTKSPRIQGTTAVASGRLPKEIIQRTVRQSFGRFRMCYEQGLRTNPSLAGRVEARFVIGSNGAVSVASTGGDLPDAGVMACVKQALFALSFPAPESGVVSVVYPIAFSPD